MGGISGCIPAHCDAYRAKADAVNSAGFLYDDCRGVKTDLYEYHYCDRVSGNDYVSVVSCDCPTPWIHSEMDTPDNWPEYNRFVVVETCNGYKLVDLWSEKEVHIGDGVNQFFTEKGNPISPGTKHFLRIATKFYNDDPDETTEVHGFDRGF